MPRTPPTLAELRAHIEGAKRLLDATRPKLAEAITRANDDTDDGYKQRRTGPAVAGGDDDNDLFRQAFVKVGRGDNARWLPKKDAIRDTLNDLVRHLRAAEIAAAAAYNAATELCALDPEEARRLLEQTESKCCANCSRPVAGTRADPFRSGRCFDCYRYRLSHNGAERPRELWVA